MSCTIVIMQTAPYVVELVIRFLEDLGLKDGVDYRHFMHEPNPEVFVPGMRQLFITGTFNGRHEGVREMVESARKRNKELVTISFSVDQIDGPFELSVVKNVDGFKKIRQAIRDFLDGSLVRTT